MNQITVISLGPGDRAYITLGAMDTMKNARRLILRTARCDAADYLKKEGVAFDALDPLYDSSEDFDELNKNAVNALLEAARTENVVYAVFDAAQDETVKRLMKTDAPVTLTPGVPLAAPLMCAAKKADAQAVPASMLENWDANAPLLLTELDSPLLAGEIKLRLLPEYGEKQQVLFFPPEKKGAARAFEAIELVALDRQRAYDHTAAALIVPVELAKKERFSFDDLVRVMDKLRSENGCPWDREQTHQSLRQYLIEEAYETTAAIDDEDWPHAADELGDVLLQVVFQANIGRQYGTFELSDITTAICKKMIARHPHIFGDASALTSAEVTTNWEELKRRERGISSASESLMDVSRGLPPLMRAEKVQKKAALVNFDFDGPEQALLKVHEEADEVLEELRAQRDPAEEVGDLLFSCVNVGRLSHVECETALIKAAEKFVKRFQSMENLIKTDGKSFKDLTTAEMDVYWNRSKHRP